MNEAERKKIEAYLKGRTPEELWESLTKVTNYIITKPKDR